VSSHEVCWCNGTEEKLDCWYLDPGFLRCPDLTRSGLMTGQYRSQAAHSSRSLAPERQRLEWSLFHALSAHVGEENPAQRIYVRSDGLTP
jgi:hypothetical protein